MKIFLVLLILSLGGCSGGSTTGNPVTVSLRMVDEQPFAWWRPLRSTVLIPQAHAAASSVYFCFKRLRFKRDATGGASENRDLNLGRVAIDANGTSLATVTIPAGRYERVEFDLEEECDGVAGRPSVEFVNTSAPFNHSTTDRMTIKFEGAVSITAATTLDLNVDLFFDEMDTFTSTDDIKTLFEALSGDF